MLILTVFNFDNYMIIKNQHIAVISEGSCDTGVLAAENSHSTIQLLLLYFVSNRCSLGDHRTRLPKKPYQPF